MNKRSKSQLDLNLRTENLRGASQLKNFVLPDRLQAPNPEKYLEVMKKINPIRRYSNTFLTNPGIFNLSLPCKNSMNQIVHKYALPGKTILPKKIIHLQNLEKFNPKIRELMRRFAITNSAEHVVKIENKDMRGWKKNSILALRMLKTQAKRIRVNNFE